MNEDKVDKIKKQQAQLLALYRMVLADGNVDPREITQLYRLGVEEFGLTEVEVQEAVFTENYAVYVPEDPLDKAIFLYQMALIAAADGEIADSERELLVFYIKAFDFNSDKAIEMADILLNYALQGLSVDEFRNSLSQI